mmetsp:Transcript_25165/g.65663  ORF Transcript_25165/g.65663 Transcript_25165/m.65663 type:complete len:264 (-) Transcript_25165:1307-2098(-)
MLSDIGGQLGHHICGCGLGLCQNSKVDNGGCLRLRAEAAKLNRRGRRPHNALQIGHNCCCDFSWGVSEELHRYRDLESRRHSGRAIRQGTPRVRWTIAACCESVCPTERVSNTRIPKPVEGCSGRFVAAPKIVALSTIRCLASPCAYPLHGPNVEALATWRTVIQGMLCRVECRRDSGLEAPHKRCDGLGTLHTVVVGGTQRECFLLCCRGRRRRRCGLRLPGLHFGRAAPHRSSVAESGSVRCATGGRGRAGSVVVPREAQA